ncbi:MAG TPA: gluconate 2-dehydrogenase subunit 3 family protein [Vicinamibacteria bacterium]|nr:gluconate 2-dehydrogenase subunit 3 family protein [Vicinamibacteria bacterium]
MKQDRRRFLKVLGVLSATSSAGAGLVPAEAADGTIAAPPGTPLAAPETYAYLTAPEVSFLEAALARLIPEDELGPGAKEAGVAVFIDRQLAGEFGAMSREYRSGPWPEGTPQQGYQSRLTPREVYRAAIAETDERCLGLHGKRFAALEASQQEDVLKALDEGTLSLTSAPSRTFFALLWQNTQEGFFADPIHGGNRDKAGWRLVGFPGVAAVYTEQIEKHGVPYRVEPVSIADLRQGRAKVDAHGHPVHQPTSAPKGSRP